MLLAKLERRRGNNAIALRHARAAFELAPDAYRAGRNYAQVLMWNGRYEEALTILEQLLRTHPRRLEIKIMIARALFRSEREGEARNLLVDIPAENAGEPEATMTPSIISSGGRTKGRVKAGSSTT